MNQTQLSSTQQQALAMAERVAASNSGVNPALLEPVGRIEPDTSREQQCKRRAVSYFELFNRLEPYRQERDTDLAQLKSELGVLVSESICFEDPFGAIQGRLALAKYLIRFADQIPDGRFELRQLGWDGASCMMLWNFEGRSPRFGDADGIWRFDGVSVLYFDQTGLIERHIDYWDSGMAVYHRLPLLGWFINLIRRRIHRG